MPPKTQYPTPSLRLHHGAWKIVWSHDGKQYSVSTGLPESDKVFAEKWRADFAVALRSDNPDFPEKFRNSPSVIRYAEERYGVDAKTSTVTDPGQWIEDYIHEIKGRNTSGWVRDSLALLERLSKASGGLQKINEQKAATYMADVATKRTAGTHNRNLTVFKKFYSWLVNTRRYTSNPFATIKRMKEGKDTPIVYCTQAEREEIISMAKETGWPEWFAVPVAFYSGMRREEIANLLWEDVRMDAGRVVVTKSKTGTSRTLPLNATLAGYFEAIPQARRRGFVIEVLDGEDRIWRLNSLVNKLKKMKCEALLGEWNIPRPHQSKSKEYHKKRKVWAESKKAKDTEIHAALERIGWNSFRHTFGSLLAQNGVSLDKISAWMGNTPEVCRRHYAQFIPRDRRDSEIDKL